ncbi:MAG: pyridoxamine 5'-phosphate oxidase family protein [Desulfobacterota bacterium]|nr:pyridoxamine 5'-phosphate oxidase family protein [Thermodesulfobacteriota bacterium]
MGSTSDTEKNILSRQIQKNTKTKEEIEQDIRAFLNEASSGPGTSNKPGCPLKHGLACVLATVHNGIPRATPIDFFADGLTIWCAGEPGLKIRNIRSNPKVAVGIYHPMDHSRLNRSLQISGTATLLSYGDDPDAFIERLKIMGIYDAAAKIIKEMYTAQGKQCDNFEQELINHLRRFNLIKIEPEEITMLRIHPTEGTEKNVWKREER